jgi:CheY-like chemotaxis protein
VVAQSAPTILVVDDDAHIRQFVCEALDFEGYETRPAVDGRAALDVLAGWRPDLILLDLNMPRMDGWSFCARQQETPEIADIPIALMSAAHNIHSRPLPCEPVAILEKPFELDDLLDHVAHVLTRRQGGAEGPSRSESAATGRCHD